MKKKKNKTICRNDTRKGQYYSSCGMSGCFSSRKNSFSTAAGVCGSLPVMFRSPVAPIRAIRDFFFCFVQTFFDLGLSYAFELKMRGGPFSSCSLSSSIFEPSGEMRNMPSVLSPEMLSMKRDRKSKKRERERARRTVHAEDSLDQGGVHARRLGAWLLPLHDLLQ